MSFIESYKRLDNLCKDLYKSETGVTTYINNMECLTHCRYQVESWDSDYRSLKHYRHIRNQIVHDNNVTEGNSCSDYDIQWVEQFHQRVLQQTDPIALYHRAVVAAQQKTAQSQKSTWDSPPRVIYEQYSYTQISSKSIWVKIASLFRRNN